MNGGADVSAVAAGLDIPVGVLVGVLGWLVSALAVVLCAAVWWVCARLELLFTAAGVRELANLGADGARERLSSVQLEALTPFVALYGWR